MGRWIIGMMMCWVGAQAQTQDVRWHRGVVVKNDGAVKVGEVSWQAHDVLLFRGEGNHVQVLTPLHVQSFRYYDAPENINRHFVTYVESEGPVKRHMFFETVVHGPIGVWRQYMGQPTELTETAPGYYRYYLYFNQQLLPFQRFYKDVFPMVKALGRGPREAVNPHRKADALLWIQWYNQNYASALAAGLVDRSATAFSLRSK